MFKFELSPEIASPSKCADLLDKSTRRFSWSLMPVLWRTKTGKKMQTYSVCTTASLVCHGGSCLGHERPEVGQQGHRDVRSRVGKMATYAGGWLAYGMERKEGDVGAGTSGVTLTFT